jgi:hypothetical protein
VITNKAIKGKEKIDASCAWRIGVGDRVLLALAALW